MLLLHVSRNSTCSIYCGNFAIIFERFFMLRTCCGLHGCGYPMQHLIYCGYVIDSLYSLYHKSRTNQTSGAWVVALFRRGRAPKTPGSAAFRRLVIGGGNVTTVGGGSAHRLLLSVSSGKCCWNSLLYGFVFIVVVNRPIRINKNLDIC